MSDNDENVDVMKSSSPHITQARTQSVGMKNKMVKNYKEYADVDDVDDELNKITIMDPKQMTSRQRAMFEKRTNNKESTVELVALPSGYKKKVLTPEMLQKHTDRLLKRRQLADEKRENDKKRTLERLLKVRESKFKRNAKGRMTKRDVNTSIVYTSRGDKVSLQFPKDIDFPLKKSIAKPPPDQKMCGMDGCENPKKYSCSQTGVPLCSLQCYKANQLKIGKTGS